jgi:hypothetical protein
MSLASIVLAATVLLGCDRFSPAAPEPVGQVASAPGVDDTAATTLDCDGPGPPVPRCPPQPGTACEAMWKKVEAWRAACGTGQAEPEESPGTPQTALEGPVQSFSLRTRSGRLPSGISTVDVEGVVGEEGLTIAYRARLPQGGELRELAWSGVLTGADREAWVAMLQLPPTVPAPKGRGGGERLLVVRSDEGERSLHLSTSGVVGELLVDLKHRAQAE